MDLFGEPEAVKQQPKATEKGTTKRIMVPLGDVLHRPYSVTEVSKTCRIIWNEGPGWVLDKNGR